MAAAERVRKLTVLLTLGEQAMLEQLAEADGRSSSNMVRSLIVTNHARRFDGAKPRATAPTLRGILRDLTGKAHYTAGNIATRAGVTLDAVAHGLKTLERKGVVRHIGDAGELASWEVTTAPPSLEAATALATSKGIDLDAAIGGAS